MKLTLFSVLVLMALPCCAQTTTTGKAETTGACSPAVSGNDNKFTITCSGVGKEQGQKILSILNKILTNQLDAEQVMVKLDEISKTVNRPAQSAPNGINIGRDNNGVATVNNFTPPPDLTMSDAQRDKITAFIGKGTLHGKKISIYVHSPTAKTQDLGNKLKEALEGSGAEVAINSGMFFLPVGRVLTPGISFTSLAEEDDEAAGTIAKALIAAGVITRPVPATRVKGPSAIWIVICPSRQID